MENSPEKEDLLYVKEVLSGRLSAFDHLVEKYQNHIYDLSLRMIGNRTEAEEITQEIFLRAFKKLPKFKIEYKFSNWLYTLALNLIRNYIRKKKILSFISLTMEKETENGEEITIELCSSSNDVDTTFRQEHIEKWVEKLVMSLSPTLRASFILRYIHNLSYEEISNILGLSLNTVKVQLHRAKTYLYEKFHKEFDETFL